MSLRWSQKAKTNLISILTYVARDDLGAARQLISDIVDSAEKTLSAQPLAGRQGQIADTREWVAHKRYIVVYRVEQKQVTVLAVLHTSLRWPKEL